MALGVPVAYGVASRHLIHGSFAALGALAATGVRDQTAARLAGTAVVVTAAGLLGAAVGDDAIRPAFPAKPSNLADDGWPTYRLHQRLIGVRRRNPWLVRARITVEHLTNESVALCSADGEHRLLLLLNIADEPRQFPVDLTGLAVVDHPDGASVQDPAVVPGNSWVLLG